MSSSPLKISRPLDLLYPDSAYGRKLDRALEHLDEIEDVFVRYQNCEPYVPVRDRETNPNPRVWLYRAELREEITPRLPVLIGDFIHNLRASLDHLQAALVPPDRKRHVAFPIEWEDPWRIDENTGTYIDGLANKRTSWKSAMQGTDPVVEAFIKELQPYREPYAPEHHPFAQLSVLDNADKHYELVTVATGIRDARVVVTNGQIMLGMEAEGTDTVLSGGVVAQFNIRPSDLKAITDDAETRELILATMADGNAEMDVELTGTPSVAIRPGGGLNDKLIPIPEGLEHLFQSIWQSAFVGLEPYVLPHGRVV
jgi:hypothetical protein